MFDRTDIRAAVEAGAISDEGAKRFEAFLKARNDPERMLDPENLRFLSNFNDVFLTIGIVVLMAGLGFLSAITMIDLMGLPRMADPETIEEASAFAGRIKMVIMLAPLPLLVGAWLLAEYFTGRRRLLLPSMALSFFVVWAASIAAAGLASQFISDGAMLASQEGEFNPIMAITGMGYAGFAAATLASAALFWRFRLPFSLFLLAGSIAGLFYTAVVQFSVSGGGDFAGVSMIAAGAVTLAVGLGTLVAAILFDMKDPTRSTRNSDHAFWLHMAAAPQIIFGVRALVLGSGFDEASTQFATVMLIVLVLFGVISLAINRRALIVSGLVTFTASLWVLVNNSGWSGLNSLMLTALIVGGSIVLLGGGWRTVRRTVLKVFPQEGTLGRIFPPEPA